MRKLKAHMLTPRERVQVIASLRFWGRTKEVALIDPADHPMCKARFVKYLPMSLDELETLIGRLDGSWTATGLRPWNATKYL